MIHGEKAIELLVETLQDSRAADISLEPYLQWFGICTILEPILTSILPFPDDATKNATFSEVPMSILQRSVAMCLPNKIDQYKYIHI